MRTPLVDQRARVYVCTSCLTPHTAGPRGPIPARCPGCRNSPRTVQLHELRRRVAELDQENIRLLEALQDAEAKMDRRRALAPAVVEAPKLPPVKADDASREGVQRAIVMLRSAGGEERTRLALLVLAARATAWAARMKP